MTSAWTDCIHRVYMIVFAHGPEPRLSSNCVISLFPVFHERIKHIEIDYHAVRQYLQARVFSILLMFLHKIKLLTYLLNLLPLLFFNFCHPRCVFFNIHTPSNSPQDCQCLVVSHLSRMSSFLLYILHENRVYRCF